MSMEMLRDARSKYEDQLYFVLRLSANGRDIAMPNNTGLVGFSELVQVLSFG